MGPLMFMYTSVAMMIIMKIYLMIMSRASPFNLYFFLLSHSFNVLMTHEGNMDG